MAQQVGERPVLAADVRGLAVARAITSPRGAREPLLTQQDELRVRAVPDAAR
ncbi:hypothetical protein Arub01_26160 [Actinomadura rubrobrunea]|uniref:Uncharacterized protein n=1 Tax=Actinomadura rubrobrunea TaxID=115335 RepID=A0A9W6PVF9_9ACTN|nr:hypothetical protein Arub01_26160 [Actinomadura rubrobrunea]